MNQVLTP